MLSERERRVLQEIEQQISGEDPRFAASMQRSLSDRECLWGYRGLPPCKPLSAPTAGVRSMKQLSRSFVVSAVVTVIASALATRRRALHVPRSVWVAAAAGAAIAANDAAAYKRPKAYRVGEALPVTAFGKVDKKAPRGSWPGW
jgi:hypothetical protein